MSNATSHANQNPKSASKISENAGCSRGLQLTIAPTVEQQEKLSRWIGASRWVWNWALAQQVAEYEATGKRPKSSELSRRLTQAMINDPQLSWLKEIPRTCLTQALNSLEGSWSDFFDGIKGKRPDRHGKPRFKSRGSSRESVKFQVDPRHLQPFDLLASTLRLAKLGPVNAIFSESVPGRVSAIAVRRKGDKWLASLSMVDMSTAKRGRQKNWSQLKVFANPLDPDGMAALDGSVPFGAVTTCDGKTAFPLMDEAFKARQAKHLENRKRYQRKQARQQKEQIKRSGLDPRKPLKKGAKLAAKSNRQLKLERKVAGLDLKMLFARNDLIHKFTTDLVRNHHTIVVETLRLQEMAQSFSRGFRRSFHRACMGEITRQLKYKCEWYGRKLIFVDQWFPSSKLCSVCQEKNASLTMNERAWTCARCLTRNDRDTNAAINLWQEGWRLLHGMQQASTNCQTVGSTVSARRAHASPVAARFRKGACAVKRESSRKTLALPATVSGMDPDAVAVG